jgi:hypothetical protein
MSLPWDELKPDVPAPSQPVQPQTTPVAPVPEPPNLPATQDANFAKMLAEALIESARKYAGETVGAIRQGETVDVLHPTITAETSTGKELVVADAKSRSWRTFLQGLAIDIFAALAVIFGTVAQIDTPMDKTAWIAVGALAVKTLVQTVLSYFMRLRITPTIRTQGDKMAVAPTFVAIPQEKEK